ncbi:uncharacterized protein LOC135826402 [Sycon ciliatum]|uniref:uncharacterized protein LOC135826402 n=1 Tax=Sycon ciliatum TaxID=27933 RepID=UPI0031F6919A
MTRFIMVVALAWITSLMRLTSSGIHVYVGFACSFNDTTVSLCQGVDSLGQPAYNIFEAFSFYLESTTLLGFLLVLCLWENYYFSRLVLLHLARMPSFFILLMLILTCMILEPFCTLDTQLHGISRDIWVLGYELELATYFMSAMCVLHVSGDVLCATINSEPAVARSRVGARVCRLGWQLFLVASAIHSILLAAYDTMKISSTLRRRHIPHSDFDSLSLIVSITTRSYLANTFYTKLFDWPQEEDSKKQVNDMSTNFPRPPDREVDTAVTDGIAASASDTAETDDHAKTQRTSMTASGKFTRSGPAAVTAVASGDEAKRSSQSASQGLTASSGQYRTFGQHIPRKKPRAGQEEEKQTLL